MPALTSPAYVVHDAKEDFKLEEITLGDMQGDELLVEMKYSGICHTDLVFQQGQIRICDYPAVFGHEGAGWVRAVGSNIKDKTVQVGDFVLLSINFCQKCKFCKRGHPADCVEGTRLHLKGVRNDGSTAGTLSASGDSDITAFDVRGELCVKGPLVVQGYYLNPVANGRDWDDEGYFHTGDIALRASGNKLWYIVGRKKELVKHRGFQVAPVEVEGALLEHPEIIDAAVIGVPARKASDGEDVRAYLTVQEGSSLTVDEVQEFMRARLAKYKQCNGGIVIGAEIPKSLSGKILKRLLVERAQREMALEKREAKI